MPPEIEQAVQDALVDATLADEAALQPATTSETIENPEAAPPEEPKTALEAVTKALKKTPETPADGVPAPIAGETPAVKDASGATPAEQPKARDELHTFPQGLSGEARGKFKALSDHALGLEGEVTQVKERFEQVSQQLNGFEDILKDLPWRP